MKVLLVALTCFALVAAACGGSNDDADGSGSAGDSARNTAPTAPDNAAPESGGTQTSAAPLDTKLVVATSIDLQVQALRDAFDLISMLARDAGGFVAEARLTEAGENNASAALRLRVPVSRHDDVVAGMRAVTGAEIKREESNAKEVTAEYTDLESRVVNLHHTEAQYQQLLTRAGTIDEVLKVTAKLDSVRGEIEQVQGRINLLDDQSSYATVTARLSLPPLVVTPAEEPKAGLPSPLRVFVDAMETSFIVAHAVANVMVVLFVAGLWILPAGVVGMLAWRRFRAPIQALSRWLT